MKGKIWLTLLVLTAIGLGISIFQTYSYNEFKLGDATFTSACNIGEKMNCRAVEASGYAELFAGIPLSAFAAGWYLALLILLILGQMEPWKETVSRLAVAMYGFGTVMSLIYLYIMFGKIQKICLYCLGVDTVNFLGLGLALKQLFELKKQSTPAPKASSRNVFPQAAGIIGACVLVSALVAKAGGTMELTEERANALVERVLYAPPVSIQMDANTISIGPADAPITLVKFADFQCPHCQKGAYVVHPLIQKYPTKVRFVYRNFPLDSTCNRKMPAGAGHAVSCEAAKASVCAFQQGKFDELYQLMFEHQADLVPGSPRKYALELGMDGAKYDACMNDPKTLDAVKADIEEGIRLAIPGTPAFFINGHPVEGPYPTPIWEKIIERLLQAP